MLSDFDREFLDLNYKQPIQKTKGSSKTSLKNQPEEVQAVFNEDKSSKKTKDLLNYF